MSGFLYMILNVVNVKHKRERKRKREKKYNKKKKKYMLEKIDCIRNIRFIAMLNGILINEK